MISVRPLPSFERSVKKLTLIEKRLLANSLNRLNTFIATGESAAGFRFKKINHDKYEFRVDIRLRVIIKKEGNIYYLVLAGDHNQIRRYLRNFR